MAATEDRKTARTPITLKIKFKSSSLDQFIERYSVDVSRGGIFIRTKEPLPVGTSLRFEFQLQDGASLIGGEGTVVWNRAYDPSRSGVAPGMGVRFDKLTADSQRVLERILSEKHKRGEAQLESRFDAGVRASRESRGPLQEFTDTGASLPSHPSPSSSSSSHVFGEEPTRMMAAEQVNALAAQMRAEESFNQDQPTRRASVEEMERAMAASRAGARTGHTVEQVRLGSGASGAVVARPSSGSAAGVPTPMALSGNPRVTSMGLVTPQLAAGTVPASAPTPVPLQNTPPGGTELDLGDLSDEAQTPRAAEPAAEQGARTLETLEKSPLRPSRESPPLFPDAASNQADIAAALAPLTVHTGPAAHAALPTLQGQAAPALDTLISPPPAESAPFAPSATSSKAGRSPVPMAAPSGEPSLGSLLKSIQEEAAPELPPADLGSGPVFTAPLIPPVEVAAPAETTGEAALPPAGLHRPQELMDLPTPPPGEAGGRDSSRLPWLMIILVLGLLVAGTIAYAVMNLNKQPPPVVPPVVVPAAQPAPPVAPPPQPAAAPDLASPSPDGAPLQKDNAGGAAVKPELSPPRQAEEAGEKPVGKAEKDKDPGLTIPVTSEPAGAVVTLAGKELGKTPLEVKDLEAGKSYELKLALPGHQEGHAKLKFAEGQKVSVKLAPFERVLEIQSTPKGAEVQVDGKRVGRTPVVVKHLDWGTTHSVELKKTGFATQTRTVSETDGFALNLKTGKEVLGVAVTLEPAKKEDREKAAPKAKKPEPAQKPESPPAEPKAAEPKAAEPKAAEPAKDKEPAKEPEVKPAAPTPEEGK